MKFYRYMSIEEFNKLVCGVVLTRDSKHFNGKYYKKAKTTSHGFCFVGEETSGVYADPINIDDWYATVGVCEYCVESYSRETMKPLRYAFVESCRNYQWYDFN